MGMGSIWHWLILLVVIALVFGTKKLRNIGEDVGSAVKSFRKGIRDEDESSQLKADPPVEPVATSSTEQNRVEK